MSSSKPIEPFLGSGANIAKRGRILALDLGEKRVGVAVTDELRITIRPLPLLRRTSWKKLVQAVAALIKDFDAQQLVIGLPLGLDGAENTATREIRRQARNFELSLRLPVFFQDERLTSHQAESELRRAGYDQAQIRECLDSQAAVLILRDYLARE